MLQLRELKKNIHDSPLLEPLRKILSDQFIGEQAKSYVLGWGPVNKRKLNIKSKYLRVLELTTMTNEKCKRELQIEDIKDCHICAVSQNGNFAEVSTPTYNNQ